MFEISNIYSNTRTVDEPSTNTYINICTALNKIHVVLLKCKGGATI